MDIVDTGSPMSVSGPVSPLAAAAAPLTAMSFASSSTSRSASKGLWVSVDPRTGGVSLYPSPVIEVIETALAIGRRNVSLSGCGGIFERASIEFDTNGAHSQRTANGRRDVRRIEVAADAREMVVHVARERVWRIAEFSLPGLTQEHRLDISTVMSQLNQLKASSAASASAAKEVIAKATVAQCQKDDLSGRVGLWEWCRLPEPPDAKSVPDSHWGVYSEEQDGQIEEAFRKGMSQVTITLGIRTYDIIFDGPVSARQVDRALRKRRHVRRRAVSPAAREEAMRKATSPTGATNERIEEEECAICYTSFAETLTMPVVQLPGCGHTFHGACAQQLADKNAQCPMCRAHVDWQAAFGDMAR